MQKDRPNERGERNGAQDPRRAERPTDPDERRRLLSIAIIGGGPAGVELAGSIAELSRHTLARDFRTIDPTGFQHRLLVSMQWLWRYLTYERGARLIAGDYVEVDDPAEAPVPREWLRPADPAEAAAPPHG